MATFKIVGADFDGGTDKTDDHILRVWCKDEAWLTGSLKAAPHLSCSEMKQVLSPDEYDFILPKDVQALHDRLRAIAGIPLLSQVKRGKEYYHPQHGDVTFIASDPDDGAYLICKYWCEEDDEQKYFGCEASDLRFIQEKTL